jgi:putative transcriptional regulator
MPYKPLTFDRNERSIMGVSFANISDFDATLNAIGTVMYEGFEPTPKNIEIIRDYISDKITLSELIKLSKEKAYA